MTARKLNRESRVVARHAATQGVVLTATPERRAVARVIVDIKRRERPVLDDATVLTARTCDSSCCSMLRRQHCRA